MSHTATQSGGVNAHMEQADSQLSGNTYTTDDGETVRVVTVFRNAVGVWFESGPNEGEYGTVPLDSVTIE